MKEGGFVKRYIKSSEDVLTYNIDIVVNIRPDMENNIAAGRIKPNIKKIIPKGFSISDYNDFMVLVIGVITDEFGFRYKTGDTSDEKSMSYYYTFFKQADNDKTIKLVLHCRVSDHDWSESPDAIARRKGHYRHMTEPLRTADDKTVKWTAFSINVNDKRYKNYGEALNGLRETMEALDDKYIILPDK